MTSGNYCQITCGRCPTASPSAAANSILAGSVSEQSPSPSAFAAPSPVAFGPPPSLEEDSVDFFEDEPPQLISQRLSAPLAPVSQLPPAEEEDTDAFLPPVAPITLTEQSPAAVPDEVLGGFEEDDESDLFMEDKPLGPMAEAVTGLEVVAMPPVLTGTWPSPAPAGGAAGAPASEDQPEVEEGFSIDSVVVPSPPLTQTQVIINSQVPEAASPPANASQASGTGCASDTPPPGLSCQDVKFQGLCMTPAILDAGLCSITCGFCAPSPSPLPPMAPTAGNDSVVTDSARSPTLVSSALNRAVISPGCVDVAPPGYASCDAFLTGYSCDANELVDGTYCQLSCQRCVVTDSRAPGAGPVLPPGSSGLSGRKLRM